ncbi:MAG: terminase large subunit, partial [Oscillospiraceae bacterium]
MKAAKFPIRDQPQLFIRKSEGLRYIEASAKRGTLYYCHAEPFEYCVQNVKGSEKADDMVMYEKIAPNLRIDVFDCSV